MPVISPMHSNSVSMTKLFVNAFDFVHGLLRALNRKEIEHGSRDPYRPRIHQQKQAGMVQSVRDHSLQVLLRVAVGIFEDAVVNAHWQSSDVARRRDNFDTRIKRGNQRGLKSTAAGSGNVDAIRIHIRTRE